MGFLDVSSVGRLRLERRPEEADEFARHRRHDLVVGLASGQHALVARVQPLLGAIRHGDDRHLKEELGDLLLQVVLHARIAGEAERFDLNDVAEGISDKLIRRHPHVFGDGEASDSEAVRRSWEAIKAAEKGDQPLSSSPLSDQLAGKVRGQPALAG